MPAIGAEALPAAAARVVAPAVGPADATNAAIGGLAGGGGQAAADAVPDQYKPLAATIGGMAAGALPVAGVAGVEAARAAGRALPPMSAAGREAAAQTTVGREIANVAGGRDVAIRAIDENPDIIPGSQGTLAQRTGNEGIAQWEDVQRTQNKGPFISREAEQQAARAGHLAGVQVEGNPQELAEGLKQQAAAADQATQVGVDQAQRAGEAQRDLVDTVTGAQLSRAQGAQTVAADALKNPVSVGSPQDVATHFRSVRDALDRATQAAVDHAESEAEAVRRSASPSAQSVGEAGAAARGPVAEALSNRKAADEELYNIAKIPDAATVPANGIVSRVREIREGISPENRPMEGEEKRLMDLAAGYGDHVQFNRLKDLRSSILDEAAASRRDNPQAYRRLNMLRGAVEDAMDHGVESQAALDEIAIKRGTMAPEDAMVERLRQMWNVSSAANLRRNVAGYRAGDIGTSEGPAFYTPGSGGTDVQGRGGFSQVEGNQGIPTPPRGEPVAPGKIDALKTANASYRDQKQTFAESPIGDILEKQPRGAEYRLSDAEVPKKIFPAGDKGGDAVKAYLKAAGPERGKAVLSDLASFMLHEKAFPGGVPDVKKISGFLDSYKTALAALPPEVRTKFETVGSAQRAVEDALAQRRARVRPLRGGARCWPQQLRRHRSDRRRHSRPKRRSKADGRSGHEGFRQ